jgi:23S rRNA (cytosine1962-C5)-methyltransferase
MRAADVWPDFRPEWILFEDAAVIVVHKEPGIPSQAPEEHIPNDVRSRLARYLAFRDGVPEADVYLGVHQRLDQPTSGVLLFARAKEANASLAKQFEGRTATKRYVAGVHDWSYPGERRIEHWIETGHGEVHAVRPGDRHSPKAKYAVMLASVRRTAGRRTLLEVGLETGRTHQIRAQLAAERAAIVGDREHGGVAGPRLLLHAENLTLAHPISGEPLSVTSPLPVAFECWLGGEDGLPTANDELRRRLRIAVDARFGMGRFDAGTTAFRLVHGAGDGLPGIALDRYGDHLVLHLASEEADAREPEILDAVQDLGFDGVYVKRRPKQASTLTDTRQENVAPAEPLRGTAAPEEFTIVENDIPYLVRLGDGLSTGIFLDQRQNRARIRDRASGARVLNLFAYTCAFSVAAARGGAAKTVSVDVAEPALAAGRKNLALAGADPRAHETVRADVFDALSKLRELGQRFDLVIVDPPTFATTRSSRFTSGRDWEELLEAICPVLSGDATILACSNDERLTEAAFRKLALGGISRGGRDAGKMTTMAPPRDFPQADAQSPTLKTLWIEVRPPSVHRRPDERPRGASAGPNRGAGRGTGPRRR